MKQISKKKTFKNKQKGGSGQKQFEVAPIGETGGSSDAQSSIINAKLTQLNAQQTENSKFEGNLTENYDLGDKVGGKRKINKNKNKKYKITRRKTKKYKITRHKTKNKRRGGGNELSS
jgi:hypothetical protein